MKRVTMLGGPRDGETVKITQPTQVIRVAVAIPPRDWAHSKLQPSFVEVDYDVYGNEARWEGMVSDAYALYQVTAEALFDRSASASVRAMIREYVTQSLQRLAPYKQLDRTKVWRAEYDVERHMVTFTALVGPHRVKNGLMKRRERRDSLVTEAIGRVVG